MTFRCPVQLTRVTVLLVTLSIQVGCRSGTVVETESPRGDESTEPLIESAPRSVDFAVYSLRTMDVQKRAIFSESLRAANIEFGEVRRVSITFYSFAVSDIGRVDQVIAGIGFQVPRLYALGQE